jgi:hypothetical protein
MLEVVDLAFQFTIARKRSILLVYKIKDRYRLSRKMVEILQSVAFTQDSRDDGFDHFAFSIFRVFRSPLISTIVCRRTEGICMCFYGTRIEADGDAV